MPSGSGSPGAIVTLVTVPTAEVGRDLARHLIEERLAACVNILPAVTSIYRWEGRVEEAAEALLIVKTTSGGYEALEAAIRAKHPYDVPEILSLPVASGLEPYLSWLVASVG